MQTLQHNLSLHQLVLPDAWQSEAIQALRAGRDVIIDAPTGAGKTYVFEKYIEGMNLKGQAVYTVPTRALANDKYAEWKARGWRVGIITGDVSVDETAPVIVATLEAVSFRRKAPELIVIDEYQWLRDPHRGNHYEGFILSVPRETHLLLLSGSVANPQDVQSWLTRLGRNVALIRHGKRPVPLEEIDLDQLDRQVSRKVEGYWTRRIFAALREDLGPLLIFAPHRNDAERMARQLAATLPSSQPLTLSPEQEKIVPKDLAKLLVQRIAYHHSGLPHETRGGVVEPLAKAGQLRVVVATLGLSAGINFSLRSVLIVSSTYKVEGIDRQLEPYELLQMIGRAGRRGLDEMGFVLTTQHTPRMSHCSPLQLTRAGALPWGYFLRSLDLAEKTSQRSDDFFKKLFTRTPPLSGDEKTRQTEPAKILCNHATDTGRARLVRRTKRPFRGCRICTLRRECLQLPPQPTPLWQLQRLGLLDRSLRLTARGVFVGNFSGPEGLAVAAAIEDKDYDPAEAVFDLANLFCGERFSAQEPRWSGRLALSCQKIYGRISIDYWLQWGVPTQYGAGGGTIVRQIMLENRRKGQLTSEYAGTGDIHRLVIEWKSLLRQIVNAEAAYTSQAHLKRWELLRDEARQCLSMLPEPEPPVIPRLLAEQMKPISHRFMSVSS